MSDGSTTSRIGAATMFESGLPNAQSHPMPNSRSGKAPAAAIQSNGYFSAVYEGSVRHRRHTPRPHEFRYRMAQLYLDLDEIERVFDPHRLWSVDKPNLAEFRRSDYLGGESGLPLSDAVRDCAERALGRRPQGPIRLLTHLRYAGYVFNPVSFYYCYGIDGRTLDCIVAEITNTPWKERHAYVLDALEAAPRGRALHWSFSKSFHVSPFIGMQRGYAWRFTTPADDLHVHMDVFREGEREFDATLSLRRLPLDSASLRRVLWRYPLMTARIVGAIHWQAMRLWLKRAPVHDHPRHYDPTWTGAKTSSEKAHAKSMIDTEDASDRTKDTTRGSR